VSKLILLAVLLFPVTARAEGPAAESAATADPLPDVFPADVLQRLTPEQLKEIALKREEARIRLARAKYGDGNQKVAVLVPMFFFIALFGCVLATVVFRWRRDRQLHETLRAMIERGTQIPVELLTPPRQKNADLRRGAVLVGLGLGGILFGLFSEHVSGGLWSVGLIPLLVGAGYFLAWNVERTETTDPARTPRQSSSDL
jgi:hypothetical protein